MSFQNFMNIDFKLSMLQRVKDQKNQNLCAKLRSLNYSYQSQFEEAIYSANVQYDNLKNFSSSNFSKSIQKLKLNIASELWQLDDLCYISTNYFINIQSVKLRFFKSNQNNNFIALRKTINTTENLSIRGLIIDKNDYVTNIIIRGKHKISISNSKFNGLGLHIQDIPCVELLDVKFLNSPDYFFISNGCTTTVMQNIIAQNCQKSLRILYCKNCFISNIDAQQFLEDGFIFNGISNLEIVNVKIFECRWGLRIIQCQKTVLSKINVRQIQENGCQLMDIPNFEISNSEFFKCLRGLCIQQSNGKIKSIVAKECEKCGVLLNDSVVRYDQFLCIDNVEKDVLLLNQSEFIWGF